VIIAGEGVDAAASIGNSCCFRQTRRFEIEAVEVLHLRARRPFLTSFDPQRHCELAGAQPAASVHGALLHVITGRRLNRTAMSISNPVPEIAIHNDHSGPHSGWHDTRLGKLPLNSRYLSRMQNYMDNDENKPLWGKNSRGFWLTICLMLSAVAGWLMFHAGLLH
jgi:hypothetical protein